jgi:hypothetical protein
MPPIISRLNCRSHARPSNSPKEFILRRGPPRAGITEPGAALGGLAKGCHHNRAFSSAAGRRT